MNVAMRKKREEVEQKYIGEWIGRNFPNAQKVFYQKALGDLAWRYAASSPFEYTYYLRFAKRCDAVVITPEEVVVVEAETRRPIVGLSELDVYKSLLPETPDFKPYLIGRSVRLVLLTPIPDEEVMRECVKKGIEYVVYFPEWIREHLIRWGVITE
jgi:hypothetical protein